ncbi:MAG: esterase-like activity of phytase family protein, partial [Paracoccaceae bacterium]
MRTPALTGLCLALAMPALAQETTFPATLKGHAFLPALSLIAPPSDAPQDAWVSGKFTTGGRLTAPMSVMGDTGGLHGKRPTGVMLPFIGQPLQGLSGYAMNRATDGSVYVLTDNGFGSKSNSPDALLFFHKMQPDFETGKIAVNQTIFLHDPDFKVPFRIAYEGSEARYLTGADFDPESIQLVGEEIWIGEEFGPYLIRATLEGRILAVHPTMMGETTVKGPDNVSNSATSVMGKDWTAQRSGGYEGMALQPGSNLLWPMFEKPLLGADGKPEGTFLRSMA